MFGPAAPPRTGPGAGVITARVLLAVLPLLSIGLLAWVTTLRIALIRQRTLEWVLFGLHVVASIGCLGVVGEQPLESGWSDLAMGAVLVMAVAVTAWFLVVDIRHHDPLRAPREPAPPAYNPYASPYPYPYQQSTPQAQPQAQPQPQPRPRPSPPPPPHEKAAPRISPELDELSELLRREQDGR